MQRFITILEDSATRLSRHGWIQFTFFRRPISFKIRFTTVTPTMFRSPKLLFPLVFETSFMYTFALYHACYVLNISLPSHFKLR
jgi:hypothetical protein